MKTGHDALMKTGPPKTSPGAQNMKTGLPKTSPGAQNMKTGHKGLGTAENVSGSAEHENGTRRPHENGTAETESGRAKHENGTTHSIPPKTIPGALNMKTRADALGTSENETGRTNHEKGTRRPR
jgi:hypothetical protein